MQLNNLVTFFYRKSYISVIIQKPHKLDISNFVRIVNFNKLHRLPKITLNLSCIKFLIFHGKLRDFFSVITFTFLRILTSCELNQIIWILFIWTALSVSIPRMTTNLISCDKPRIVRWYVWFHETLFRKMSFRIKMSWEGLGCEQVYLKSLCIYFIYLIWMNLGSNFKFYTDVVLALNFDSL